MCCNITHNFSFRISLVCGFKYCRHLDILYPLNYKIDEQKIIFSLLGKRFFPTPRFYFFKQTIKSPSSQIWLEEGGKQIWLEEGGESGGSHHRQRSPPLSPRSGLRRRATVVATTAGGDGGSAPLPFLPLSLLDLTGGGRAAAAGGRWLHDSPPHSSPPFPSPSSTQNPNPRSSQKERTAAGGEWWRGIFFFTENVF